MHRSVAESCTRKREKEVTRHNKVTKIWKIYFDIGDFVLMADLKSRQGNKLRVKWKGPFRILRMESEYIYKAEHLIGNTRKLIHDTRLKKYFEKDLHVTETLLDTIEHNNPHYQTVTKILD